MKLFKKIMHIFTLIIVVCVLCYLIYSQDVVFTAFLRDMVIISSIMLIMVELIFSEVKK